VREKRIPLIIFLYFVELSVKTLYMINRLWTTFET